MSEERKTLGLLVHELLCTEDDTGCDEGLTVVGAEQIMNLRHYIDHFITLEHEVVILELARVALGDGAVYEHFAEKLDLSDEYLMALREKVDELTQGVDIEY